MSEFKPRCWHPGMSDKETADLAYWERNMLALRYADGWYFDDVPDTAPGWEGAMVPRYIGWRRVLSLDHGRITFHIPDDFDVGMTKQIERNWDGHTTEEKWLRVARIAGVVSIPGWSSRTVDPAPGATGSEGDK